MKNILHRGIGFTLFFAGIQTALLYQTDVDSVTAVMIIGSSCLLAFAWHSIMNTAIERGNLLANTIGHLYCTAMVAAMSVGELLKSRLENQYKDDYLPDSNELEKEIMEQKEVAYDLHESINIQAAQIVSNNS